MAKYCFLYPPGQCFDCHSCALCCPAYEINVSPEERERIVDQGWEQSSELAGQSLFRQRRSETVLALNPQGGCVFLDDDNLCRIHAKFGEPTKPLGCRLYPFVFNPLGSELAVTVRFDCPSVVANRGRPLEEHESWLRALAKEVVPEDADQLPPPPFRSGDFLDWSPMRRLAAGLIAVLNREDLSFTRRIIAAVTMTHLMQRVSLPKLESRGLKEFLSLSEEAALKDAESDPLDPPPPAARLGLLFRQLAALYGRRDRPRDLLVGTSLKVARSGERFRQSLRFVWGRGAVPQLQADFPEVDFETLEEPAGEPRGDAAESLRRFYTAKLTALTFCGRTHYHTPFVEGLHTLWLTYPVILWFARLFTLGEERAALTTTAVRRAIRQVDWHHGRTPAFGTRGERGRAAFLSGEGPLRQLVTWYGR